MLLDIAHRQLHIEIVDVRFGDLLQPEKDRLEPTQFVDALDLLVQALQFIKRFQSCLSPRCYPTLLSY
jgi:hypothetical protein